MEEKEGLEYSEKSKKSVGQEEIQDLLFGKELSWQEIIYDLINSEQLDPWDLDITVLSESYLNKISKIEEADFFVSSKVLLAASLLLRIKSEILLNSHLKSIDEILFGAKKEFRKELERIELEEEIPFLTPKSPIPRFKKVTLKELIESLNKAINTETRRIKKEILNKNALRESSISLPKRTISIKDKIKEIYDRLTGHLTQKDINKVSYSDFIQGEKIEKALSFFPLLQLDHQKKVWLEQKATFDEIFIWLKEVYFQNNEDPFEELRKELEQEIQELEKDKSKKNKISKLEKEFPGTIV